MSDAAVSANLYQRIRAVALEVTKVDKTGKTQFGGKATSIGDVENALRGPMFEHGIITHWSEPELIDVSRETSSGKTMELWKARMSVTVVNADNPSDQFEDYWCEIGTNPMAATSFARKGYYKALFHLTGDEDEGPKRADVTKANDPQPRSSAGSTSVDADKLLDRVTESLRQLSGIRKTSGKKLVEEWMNETNTKVKGFAAMNNTQLSDLLAWSENQVLMLTPKPDALEYPPLSEQPGAQPEEVSF